MPTIFQHGNVELCALVEAPTVENLQAYFDARTSEWCETNISGEFGTVSVFYDLAVAFQGAAAFDLLNEAALMNAAAMAEKKFSRYVDLLAGLAYLSNTTAMPAQLVRNWNDIIARGQEIDPTSIALSWLRAWRRDMR